MSFLNRFVWIITSPSKVFEEIREGKAQWWQPWLIAGLIYVVVGFFAMPIQLAVMELNLSDVSIDQLDKQIELTEKFGVVQLAATPVLMLIIGLMVSGLTYILVSIFAADANFKKYFAITWWASVVVSFGQILSTIIIRLRGVDTIRSVDDSSVSVSLKFLAGESGLFVKGLLASIDFFSIWSFVLIAMGVMHVFGLNRNQALICLVPWALIYVAMTILGMVMSGMA
jgi:hypothetical protein